MAPEQPTKLVAANRMRASSALTTLHKLRDFSRFARGSVPRRFQVEQEGVLPEGVNGPVEATVHFIERDSLFCVHDLPNRRDKRMRHRIDARPIKRP